MKIPGDPTKALAGHTLFIMGAGRSGTTVLGQLIGSMRPVFYLFEPVLVRLFVPVLASNSKEDATALATAFRAALYYDYFLPRVQGRRIDPNPKDMTYYKDYESDEMLSFQMGFLNNTCAARSWVNAEQPIFALKLPELQPLAPTLATLIPDAKFIHIIRNGLDVVASCVRLGWYGDTWMDLVAVEWVDPASGAPFYMPEDVKSVWKDWNPATRAACVWRVTTQAGLDFCSNNPQAMVVFYEALREGPHRHTDALSLWLNVRQTEITHKHIKSIQEWQPRVYDSVLDDIQEPEKERFLKLMENLICKP